MFLLIDLLSDFEFKEGLRGSSLSVQIRLCRICVDKMSVASNHVAKREAFSNIVELIH